MPEEKRLPRWPLRLVLSLVLVLEAFLVVMLSVEGATEHIPMIVNSVGLLVFCVLTWRGIPRCRWLLVAFLVWRVVEIGIDIAHFDPGDHRVASSLVLIMLYVVAGSLAASPLGRARTHAAT
ncbi:MAG: hypothetical protein U9Q95_01110 [Candidatus Eisenbacteria bacterium]|nr:hypothetical protein [Candidatus Eisenbacteria bacterium]